MKADAELIAKVLDGRATANERARVLAEADESPEVLELIADSAVAVGMGMEKRRVARPAVLGIGVGLLAAAVTLFMIRPRASEIPALPFPVSIGIQDLSPARLGAGINAVRGATDGNRLQQSVIVGARLADYQVLGTDTARVTAAGEIANALRAIPGGEVAAAGFTGGEVSAEAVAAVESVVDVHAFRAAQWLELVRLSAIAGDWRTLDRADVRASVSAIAADQPLVARLFEQIKTGRDPKVVAELASQALRALSK